MKPALVCVMCCDLWSCLFCDQVLHPGIRRQVQIDLMLMKAGSLFLNCLPGIKWLSLPEIVQEFEKLMTKQVKNVKCNFHER